VGGILGILGAGMYKLIGSVTNQWAPL